MDGLAFRLRNGSYAIRLEAVGGVGPATALEPVPLAPQGVLGLAECRGDVVTVLDLPRFLGDDLPEGPCCLVRLSGPLGHLAFRLPAALTIQGHGGGAVEFVDPTAVVAAVVAGR